MRKRSSLGVWVTRVLLLTIAVGGLWLIPAEAQGGPDATVVPDGLNMRFGPGNQYSIVGRLVRGQTLTLLAREDIPHNGIWVWANTVENVQGWVSADYLDIRDDLNLETLPVRPAPDASGQQPAEQPTPDPAAQAQTQPEAPVTFPEGSGIPAQTIGTVNLRSGPGTSHRVFRTLAVGTAFLAKGRNAAGDWIFGTVDGQDGWLFAEFLRLSAGTVDSLPVTEQVTDQAASTTDQSQDAAAPAPRPVAGGAGLTGFGYGGHVDSFAYPNLMQQAGMTWVKRQLRFRQGDPGSNAAWMIDQGHASGFKVLLGIVGFKEDINNAGYYEDYARFVGEVAALGPDAIEVWNEMNIDREWPTGQIDPAAYTRLLALSYNAIKSANGSVAVISGALAPTGAEGAFGAAAVWNDDRYLRGMASAGAAAYMDCIGAHYNEGIVSPGQTGGDPRGDYYTRYFWSMVNTYSGAFGGSRPICFTELGYLSPEGYGPLPGGFAWGADTSVDEQAAWLADAVRLARGSGRVRLVIVWNVDFTGYGEDPMGGYAIIRPGGGCPACDALARIG